MTPFFITALPRSGTTFLANFFTHSGVFCWHEAAIGCVEMSEYHRRLTLRDYYRVGDSDSGLPIIQDSVRMVFPGALWISIDRDPGDVAESLKAAGGWRGQDAYDSLVASHRRALAGCDIRVPFDTLFLTETLRNLWHNVTGMRFDARRAEMLTRIRIEPHMDKYWPLYRAHLQLEETRT